MYETHFGFSARPFSLSPDTKLFVNLADHQHCFELMVHVLDSGEGFLKVIGEVGTGKTILCRKLLRHLDGPAAQQFQSVYIPNPMLSPIGLYRAVGQELGLDLSQQQDNDTLLHHINERILALAESKRSVVIVVDEAQSLPAPTLEALRLITNLETEAKKLVQVILFGQTELDRLLNQDNFRQLRQRITFAHYLRPLSLEETRQYLDYRLSRSGYNGTPLFQGRALTALHRYSQGIPRMINVLAHKALLAGYAERTRYISVAQVKRAALDSQESLQKRSKTLWFSVLMALGFVAAVVWRAL